MQSAEESLHTPLWPRARTQSPCARAPTISRAGVPQVAFDGIGSLPMTTIRRYRQASQQAVDHELAMRETNKNLQRALREGFVMPPEGESARGAGGRYHHYIISGGLHQGKCGRPGFGRGGVVAEAQRFKGRKEWPAAAQQPWLY